MRKGDNNFSNGYWYYTISGTTPTFPTLQTLLSYPDTWTRLNNPGHPSDPNGSAGGLTVTGTGMYYWRVKASNGNTPPCEVFGHDPANSSTYYLSFNYVGPPAWFRTVDNNVGASGKTTNGDITVTPPSGVKVVTFSVSGSGASGIAKGAFDTSLSQSGLGVSRYGDWSVPKSTYEYFWSKKGANATSISGLSDSLLSSCTENCIFKYEGTNPLSWTGAGGTTVNVSNNPTVIFVGTPTSSKDLSITVTTIDGFFIANGAFSSGTGGAHSDQQLFVNGAIIAHGGVNLQRDLGPGLGKNDDTPAEQIIFQPRYLVDFADLLGAPIYSWKEVAP